MSESSFHVITMFIRFYSAVQTSNGGVKQIILQPAETSLSDLQLARQSYVDKSAIKFDAKCQRSHNRNSYCFASNRDKKCFRRKK